MWAGSGIWVHSCWKSQLSLPTTTQPQHSRPWYLTGHALGTYWRAPDTQVMARKLVPGFPEMHRFCLANRPTHCPLRGNFHPPFFLLWWVWFDPKPIWQQNWWNRDQKPHFYTHTTFLAEKWHKSSPPLSPLTPNSSIFMQRCRNHWVTSDVQFRKGAWIPPFLGGQWLTWPVNA